MTSRFVTTTRDFVSREHSSGPRQTLTRLNRRHGSPSSPWKRPASLPAVLGREGRKTGRLPEQPARLGERAYSLTNRRPISSAIGALPASTTRASDSGIRSSELSTRIAATASWSQVAK